MEKFFEGEPFTTEEIVQGMAAGVRSGQITPVFCGSAVNNQALDMLLYNMDVLLPGADTAAAVGEDANGDPVEVTADPDAPLCAYVFKTVADPFVGKLSYIKVLSGKLTATSNAVNARTNQPERLGKTLTVCGKKQTDTAAITAGDIGAVAKLPTAKTGDTLCDPARVVKLPAPEYPVSTYRMAVKVAKKGDEGKVSGALARLIEEDPAITFTVDPETKQQVISGLGTQHLEVAVAKLKNKFGVEITLETPRVPYRESIRKSCKAQGRHKKQTGGHGQFGDVWIQFEPIEGEDIEFAENVFGGSVPKNYFPAVEKGVRQAAEHGVLAGYPMVGMKATLLDGSYHPVDSSEMAFIMAAKLAYKAAIPEAGPVLLEPIGTLQAHVPADNTGDIMGEVTKRRGRVLGMNPDDEGMQIVEAEVPMAEMQDFTTFLRQLTQGRGWFTFDFVRGSRLISSATRRCPRCWKARSLSRPRRWATLPRKSKLMLLFFLCKERTKETPNKNRGYGLGHTLCFSWKVLLILFLQEKDENRLSAHRQGAYTKAGRGRPVRRGRSACRRKSPCAHKTLWPAGSARSPSAAARHSVRCRIAAGVCPGLCRVPPG